MSNTDVDKLIKLVKALDSLVELGEAVLEDGKVDFSDVAQLPRLAPAVQELYGVWSSKDELLAELKDLDYDELVQIIQAVNS